MDGPLGHLTECSRVYLTRWARFSSSGGFPKEETLTHAHRRAWGAWSATTAVAVPTKSVYIWMMLCLYRNLNDNIVGSLICAIFVILVRSSGLAEKEGTSGNCVSGLVDVLDTSGGCYAVIQTTALYFGCQILFGLKTANFLYILCTFSPNTRRDHPA